MKKKIRKKRQIRLQKFIKHRENFCDDRIWNRLLEQDLKSHPYYNLSDLSFYVFIYVDFHYGWEFCEPKKIIFLYDRMTRIIEYSRCIYSFNEDVRSVSYNISFQKLRSEKVYDNVYFDDMFSCNPKDLIQVYDSGYYEIFIKAGNQRRFLFIKAPNASKYEPYKWLFNLVDKVVDDL